MPFSSALISLSRRRGAQRAPARRFFIRVSFHDEGFALWASSFFRGEKGTKTPPGEPHIAVGNKFPPAPVRSPPDPRNLRGPNSRGLPVTVRRGRDNDCPRNRAAAAAAPKSRRPGQLDQTGAPDRSRSNLCGGESAGGSGDPPVPDSWEWLRPTHPDPHPLPRLVGTRRGCETVPAGILHSTRAQWPGRNQNPEPYFARRKFCRRV